MPRPFFAFFLLGIPFFGISQEIGIKSITTVDGLSQNSVNQILEDSEGYIWLATQDGLNRYNGYEFEVFRPDPDDSFAISDNFIIQMLEDSLGRIWLSTRNGINILDPKSRRFYKLIDPFASSQKYFLRKNKGFVYWLSYDTTINTIWRIPIGIPLKNASIQASDHMELVLDRPHEECANFLFVQDQFWLLGQQSIENVFEGQKIAIDHMLSFDILSWDYFLMENNQVLLPGDHGLIGLNLASGEINISEPGIVTMTYWQRNPNTLTIGTSKGLVRMSLSDMSVESQMTSPSTQNTRVQHLYEDSHGVIWVGTANQGLFLHHPNWMRFQYLPSKHEIVWGFAQSKTRSCLGTQNGLQVLDRESGQYLHTFFEQKKITTVFFDSNLDLWIGDSQGKVYRRSGSSDEFKSVEMPSLEGRAISQFLEDSQGNLWIGGHADLIKVTPGGEKISFEAWSGHEVYVLDIFEDSEHTIWIGSFDGCHFITSSGSLGYIPFKRNDPKSINFNFASSIQETSDGTIWIATYGGGVSRLNADSTFTHFTESDGLSNNVLHDMVVDENDQIWMVSNGGLSRFQPDLNLFNNYNVEDGLASNNFTLGGGYRFRDGRIGFGTVDGFLHFDPDAFQALASPPEIKWEKLAINYEEQMRPEVFQSGMLDLEDEDRVVTLSFVALNFQNPKDVRYEYLLEGFDEQWVEADPNSRMISYSSLPFDEYVLRLRAYSSGNKFKSVEKQLAIHVHPPFWLSWWFLTLSILTFLLFSGLLVFYFSRVNLKRRVRELETMAKIQNERERISRDLHDSVGSHFTFIISKLDYLYLGWEKSDSASKRDYLKTLSDFSRSGMRLLRETIWALNMPSIPPESLKSKVSDYLNLCFTDERKTSYEFNFQHDGKPLDSAIGLNCFRIVQEAVNNALKHAEANKIVVAMSFNLPAFNLIIEDDGKGYVSEEINGKETEHYGLRNMKIRAKEMKAQVHVSSSELGTTVVVQKEI